jgi:DHA2 family multidrug resistance protein-like MFS transporter
MTGRAPTRTVPILLLSGLCALGPATFAICLPATEVMANGFSMTKAVAQGTLLGCLIGFLIGLWLMPGTADRRRGALAGLGAYAATGLVCCVIPGRWGFTTFYFLLGIPAGVCARSAWMTARDWLPALQQVAMALISSVIVVAAVIAGDELLGPVQWRGLVAVMVETSALMALGVWIRLPSYETRRRSVPVLRQSPTGRRRTPATLSRTRPTDRAGAREWLGLTVIALPCILYSMDLTVLNMTVPYLSADLRPTNTELLWIVDIYGFVLAGSLITMGTIGDRIGRRKLLLIGALAFGAASVAAAFSTTPEMLIATRALLGLAGATLAPSTLSLIRNMFHDARQRTFAIGVWSISYALGAVIGPIGGGFLLEHFWWGSVFLLAVPVMVLLLIVGPSLLPEFKNPAPDKLDVFSALLSLLSVLSFVYGFKHMATEGVDATTMICVSVGLLMGLLFMRRQGRIENALVDLELFRNQAFRASVILNTFIYFVLFGSLLFVMQYLQLVKGLSPFDAGIRTLPMAIALVVGSVAGPLLAGTFRPARIIFIGFITAAIGFSVTSRTGGADDVDNLIIGCFVSYLGLSLTITLVTDMIVGAAPPHRAGAASAISETTSELGGALGIAVLGAVSASVYKQRLADSATQPSAAPDLSHETFADALSIASTLPEGPAVAIQTAATNAFMDSLQAATQLSGVISIGIAVGTLFLLRQTSKYTERHPDTTVRRKATTLSTP